MYCSRGGVDEGKSYEFAGTGGIWEISVPSSQFCCEPKAALKKKKKVKKQQKKVLLIDLAIQFLTMCNQKNYS